MPNTFLGPIENPCCRKTIPVGKYCDSNSCRFSPHESHDYNLIILQMRRPLPGYIIGFTLAVFLIGGWLLTWDWSDSKDTKIYSVASQLNAAIQAYRIDNHNFVPGSLDDLVSTYITYKELKQLTSSFHVFYRPPMAGQYSDDTIILTVSSGKIDVNCRVNGDITECEMRLSAPSRDQGQ